MEAISTSFSKQVGIKDETFHVSHADSYVLHIIVDELSSFLLSVFDQQRNKFILLYSFFPKKKCIDSQQFVFFLNDVLLHHPELTKRKFKETHLTVSNSFSTFIPSALYLEEDKIKYFSLNHNIKADENIYSDYIRVLDAYAIYSFEQRILDFFQTNFQPLQIHHISTILVQNILIENKNRQSAGLFAHVKPEHFELIMIKEHKLVFYNRFNYKTAEDFIYYILFVCEQLHLNPENTELQLLGEIEKKSAIYSLLYKYMRNVKFGKKSDAYGFTYGFNDIPAHFYYSLMTQVFTS